MDDLIVSPLAPDVQEFVTNCDGDFFKTFEYKHLKVVARGSTCVVILSRPPNGEELKAVKILSKKLRHDAKLNKRCFEKEVSVLANVRHKNIVEMSVACECPEMYVISMPYYSGGDLRSLFRNMDDDMIATFFLEITSAVAYLHSRNVAHLDIKPDNILMSSLGNAILSDFGLARSVASEEMVLKYRCGTVAYAAPEMMNGNKSTIINFYKCDTYSLGLILWCMLVGKEAEPGQTNHLDHLPVEGSNLGCYRSILENLLNDVVPERWNMGGLVNELRATWPGMGYDLSHYFHEHCELPEIRDSRETERVETEENVQCSSTDTPVTPDALEENFDCSKGSTPSIEHYQDPVKTPDDCHNGCSHSPNQPLETMTQAPVMPACPCPEPTPQPLDSPQPLTTKQPSAMYLHPPVIVPAHRPVPGP